MQFFQLLLDDESLEYTSFKVPPLEQFKFIRTSQGLSSAPYNFQRLVEDGNHPPKQIKVQARLLCLKMAVSE
jgi:hypothetical protein